MARARHRTHGDLGIVIFEGPDGSGKTTAARGQAFLGEHVHHQGPYVGDPYIQTLGLIEQWSDTLSYVTCDRLHLGEHVYGPVLRAEDRLGFERSRLIDRRLLAEKVHLVICMPPVETVLANFERSRHAQLPNSEHDMRTIYAGYQALMASGGINLPYTVYDYTQHDYYPTMKDVLAKAYGHKNLGPGIGEFAPGGLMIVTDSPFLHMDYENAHTRRFTRDMCQIALSERQVYWVHCDDVRHSNLSWIEALNPGVIVTLGQHSERTMLGVVHAHAVPSSCAVVGFPSVIDWYSSTRNFDPHPMVKEELYVGLHRR